MARSPPLSTVSWIPNHLTDHCLSCHASFRLLNRRHHCRRCGLIFCESCSSRRLELVDGAGRVRVCDRCFQEVKDKRKAQAAQQQQQRAAGTEVDKASAKVAPAKAANGAKRNGLHSLPSPSLSSSSVHQHALRAPSPLQSNRTTSPSLPPTSSPSSSPSPSPAPSPSLLSRRAASALFASRLRVDDAEHIKLHLSEVIVMVGRLEALDAMSEEEINRKVRDRRERWRGGATTAPPTTTHADLKASTPHSRTWTGPALAGLLPPPALTSSATPKTSSSSGSSSAASSTSSSPTHAAASALSKSNSLTSIASLYTPVASANGSVAPSIPASTASSPHHLSLSKSTSTLSSQRPQQSPNGSPTQSPMLPHPYVEDDIALDDSPVIVEIRRRNSAAESIEGKDPLARYGDRMIVHAKAQRARDSERHKREREREKDARSRASDAHSAQRGTNPFYPGHLIITNYQLIFIPSHHLAPSASSSSSSSSTTITPPLSSMGVPLLPIIQLPLLCISRLTPLTFEQKDLASLSIRSKDFRRVHLLFTGLLRKGRWNAFRNALTTVEFYATPGPGDGWSGIFAFKAKGRREEQREPEVLDDTAAAASAAVPQHAATPVHVLKSREPLKARAFSEASSVTARRRAFGAETPRGAAVSPTRVAPNAKDAAGAGHGRGAAYAKKASQESDDDEEEADADADADEQSGDQSMLGLLAPPTALPTADSPHVPESSSDDSDDDATNASVIHHSAASALTIDPTPAPTTDPAPFPPPPLVVTVPAVNLSINALPTLASPLASYSFSTHHLDGWDLYDPYAEYARMGVPSRHWRICSLNQSYTLCSSYPSVLVVPKRSTEHELLQARAFRSRHRLPVFVWRRRREGDEGLGPALLRSSQPMVGLMNARSSDDELLLSHAVSSNPSASLLIVDARPVANARANLALGAGTELAENYQSTTIADCRVEYLGIENIHVMRKSYRALWKLCVKMMEEDDQAGPAQAGQFWSDFIATQHFTHLSAIIAGAAFVASTLSAPAAPTVLTHCSDGWDRTTQVTSLALLLLDAHYRTMVGFIALVEKEWLSFGHKFTDRTGLGLTASATEESPVFHQWIDAVYQVVRQHEAAFEFTPGLLIFLLDALYSGRWGTFVGNSELERVKAAVAQRSASVWGEAVSRWGEGEWVQPRYARVEGLLGVDVRRMSFWSTYYLRHDHLRARGEGMGDGTAQPAAVGGQGGEQQDVVGGVVEGMVLEVALEAERRAGEEKARRIADLEAQLQRLQAPRSNHHGFAAAFK